MSRRAYSSPLRDRQRAATRDRILDALIEVILKDGVHTFSVQSVAKRAGVAHRTVYRHFGSRQALLDGLADRLVERMSDRVPGDVPLAPETLHETFRAFDDHPDAVTASVMARLVLGLTTADRTRRTTRLRAEFAARFPNLPAAEVERTFTVVRSLMATSTAWSLLRREGLDGDHGGGELARILGLILDDLARRDAEAAAEAP